MVVVAVAANGETEKEEREDFYEIVIYEIRSTNEIVRYVFIP